jgi:hypothetical protein
MTNRANARYAKQVVAFFSLPSRALAAAGVLHLVVAMLVFGAGRSGVFPQQFDRDGLGKFALDGYTYRPQAYSLIEVLSSNGPVQWLKYAVPLHVKLYSLCFLVFRPLFGSSILAIEPLNLLYYLLILVLTFCLAKQLAGQRVAFVASAIVGLWPSLLLHTTQLLRDPLFMAGILGLILVLTKLLTRTYSWAKGLTMALAGSAAAVVILATRSQIWLVVQITVLVAIVLFAIRMLRERKLLAGNLVGIVLLLVMTTFALPIPNIIQHEVGFSVGRPVLDGELPVWARIAKRRHGFIMASYEQSGSTIDSGVEFSSQGDVIKFIPRAAEIGYLAPFPKMWFSAGYNVGLIGRLLSGLETSLTYALELMACVFLWRHWRSLQVWLLVIAAALGVLALGMVVVNVGTLYRMRYAFWVLLTILGSAGVLQLLSRRKERTKLRSGALP